MNLHLGVAKTDITPKAPVPLAGFASRRNKPFTGIAANIYARVAFFGCGPEGSSVASAEGGAILVSADLLWWGKELADDLRGKLSAIWGMPREHILLHGTHSHSGPQTSFAFHPLLGEADSGYLDELREKIIAAAEQAYRNREPVMVEKASGMCGIGIHRRTYVNGKAEMLANPEGVVDREASVLRFVNARREETALFVHYTAHPIINRANVLSAEFPGAAMNRLEQSRNGKTVAFYWQGCCGDINVDMTENGKFVGGDEQDITHFAGELVQAVERVLSGPMKPCLADASIHGKEIALPLRFVERKSAAELQAMVAAGASPLKEWAEYQLKSGDQGSRSLKINVLAITDDVVFVAMNAEMVVSYGLCIKQISKGNALPLAYTNGMVGYIPTAEQTRQGGYEADQSVPYFYLPGRLTEETEERVRKALEEAIDALKEN